MKPLLLYVLLTLTITLEAAFITDDFPNHYLEATAITFTTDVNGTTFTDSTDGDEDWFTFALERGDGVVLSGKADTNTTITLYNESTSTSCSSYGTCMTETSSIKIESFTMPNSKQLIFAKNLGVNEVVTVTTDSSGNFYSLVPSSTYYLQIKSSSNEARYSFSLRLNGAEEVETILDASTLAYCQNKPSLCGITDDVIVSDTKALCAENPTLCGIQEVKAVTAEDINSLESGWHLIGTSQAIADLSVFDTAKVVWAWNNGWKLYSPIQSIKDTISTSLNFTELQQIDELKGFWVLKE